MLIMPNALPGIKKFLKPIPFRSPALNLLTSCLVSFLMHFSKMTATQASVAIRTQVRHRAQIGRFLGQKYWKTLNILEPLQNALLEFEADTGGVFFFIVDSTVCTLQGKKAENHYNTRNTKKRPQKSQRKQKTYAKRSCHCFVMGLLITPSGIRIPYCLPFYTKDYCEKIHVKHRSQTVLAAELIEKLAVPDQAKVLVLGDTAFDAESIRKSCDKRRFRWIVPLNPNRVLAGAKPRPRVESLIEGICTDRMACVEVQAGTGKYAVYRRVSRCRIGPKMKPRTYHVHEERRDVHSVGNVRLFFSTTKLPEQGHRIDKYKILMTNEEQLPLREVIEVYTLRWQIELFFKELKSTLGLHHYRVRTFDRVESWVKICLVSFLYLETIRARKLKNKKIKDKEREWWQSQRTFGLVMAVRQSAEQNEIDQISDALKTPTGVKRIKKLFEQAHPKEYRARQ